MKKFLRFLGILILIIAVVWVILIFVEPKEANIERSITINAPKEVVWAQITNFKNWPHWDPWYRMDTSMKIEYQGTDGQTGSSFSWVSNKMGQGSMTNSSMDNGTMKYDLNTIKPMKNTANGWMKVEDAGNNQTKVTWNMHMNCPVPWNAFAVIMNPEKMMGNDFDAGLKNMKEYTEAHATMPPTVAIKETQFPGHIYCGMQSLVDEKDMDKFFMNAKNLLGQPPTWGMYWTWDTVKHQTEMAAAFIVPDSSKHMKGASFFNVKPSSACMVAYTGPYSGMMSPHMALMKYCASKNMKVSLMLEEYVKGPSNEKDSTKYLTNIYYLCDNMPAMAGK